MVEYGIDIRGEDTLVVVVYLYRGIGPPEEGLRQAGPVRHLPLNLEIGTAGTQGEASHALLVEHAFHLVHPDGHGAVIIVGDGAVDRHIGRRTVVLGPVELYAA